MKHSTPVLIVLALVSATTACAAGGPADGERTPRGQQNVLTEAQVEAGGYESAYDAVRSLRPAWLRERPMSITNPQGAEVTVYMDGARMATGIESLRQVRAEAIARMEYLSPTDATTRYGTGHTGGAILITTKRR